VKLVEFGPEDAGHVRSFVALRQAIDAVDCPWEPTWTTYRQQQYMRHSWEGEPGRWFVAYDGEEPVGTASIDASDYDNLEMALLSLRVDPELRRRGLGAAILRDLEALAGEMDRPLLMLDGWDGEATLGFAAAAGYERKSAEIRRLQVAAEAPDPRPIRDEALAHAGDYELLRVEGYAAEDLLTGLVELTAAINDAPVDDLEWEDEVYSPERVHAYERAQIESGYRFRRIVARHRPSGELAGHTVVVVDTEQPAVAEQHDTSVVRAHRGHRLGLMLKAEMMLWLAEDEPQVERVFTNNAESNRYMIAVNERLGYRPVGRIVEFQRRLRRGALGDYSTRSASG
jgi:RimJ/RimL family protein N-acetyltransferase